MLAVVVVAVVLLLLRYQFWGSQIFGEILAYVTVFYPNHRGSHNPSAWMLLLLMFSCGGWLVSFIDCFTCKIVTRSPTSVL